MFSTNFKESDLNRGRFDLSEEVKRNLTELAAQLEVLRARLNSPITVSSGYRSPQHNARVGGARASFHVTGQAADIKVRGYTPAQVYAAIEELIKAGRMKEGGLGIYNTWVHYDTRGTRARWDKRK